MTVSVTVQATSGAIGQINLADPVINAAPILVPTGVPHYVATQTLSDGTVIIYDSANAVDQGDYNGEFVHQKSLMVAPAGCPFTVFFRPDVDGSRDEVVVELGKLWSGVPANVLAPYTFSVTKDGAPLFTQTAPYHWWFARWRWQSAPRPFVRNAADLIASKHFLPHTKDYLYGYNEATAKYGSGVRVATYSPMGLAGLVYAMGTTGDRPDLGPLTLAQSNYILLGSADAKSSMIAQAEAAGSFPYHIRDEKTGRWVDNRAHPNFSFNQNITVKLPVAPDLPRTSPFFPLKAGLDSAHIPQTAYAVHLLTDDPYLLEELQAQALYHSLESSLYQWQQKLPGMVQPGQTRGCAWGIRDQALAAKCTPDVVPSWLLPKSLMLANLADSKTFAQKYVDSPARVHSLFRVMTRSDVPEAFMMDYLGIALGWVTRLGFTEWQPIHTWFMGGIIPMVTDGTGWKKGWPVPYLYHPTIVIKAPYYDLVLDTSQDSNTYASWADLFQRYVADAGNTSDASLANVAAWDGVSIMQNINIGYEFWRLGSLNLAVGLGVSGADDGATWLGSQLPALRAKYGNATNDPRWSFSKV